MTRTTFRGLFASTAFASTMMTMLLPGAAMAESAPAASGATVDDSAIIVTARRADEKLQDVPESVQAISGSQLAKLAITSAEEVSKLAPGLTLTNAGTSTEVSLRGVTWRPGSGTPATPIYINEVPFDPGNTIVSLFDIGQIEVLRGPQGTNRGAPSISGAVTIATHRPDLSEFGGFVQGQYGEANHFDVQAAVNVPIIKDKLALRLATNIENSEGNRVYSVHSTVKPKLNDRSYRATLLYRPTDTLSIEAMYQTRRTDKVIYAQVVGTGSPGAAASPLAGFGLGIGAIPANFNGPALTLAQRASVQDGGNITRDRIDLVTANVNWEVLNHKLTFNWGRQLNYGRANSQFNSADVLNILPGYEPYTFPALQGVPFFQTLELRLSSEPNPDRPFDYDIGWFSKHSNGPIDNSSPSYLAGAFGGPTALPGAFTTPNSAYVLPVHSIIGIGQVFDSFYGDVKFHIDRNTEFTAGLAIIRDRVPVGLTVTVGSGLSNAGFLPVLQGAFSNPASPFYVGNPASPFFGLPVPTTCAGVGAYFRQNFQNSAAYPGVCDAVVAAGSGAPAPQNSNPIYSKALYNFSLSHKFSDSIMVYATTGSSYRSGLPALGNVGLPAGLFLPKPETAKSYEIGIKTTWGRNLHINASVFQLDYKDQLTSLFGVPYYDDVKSTVDNGGIAFYGNANSRVRGFELEFAAQPTKQLSFGANMSYSSITSTGGTLPCAVGPTPTLANRINYCTLTKGTTLNQESPFSATVNGSYTVPIGALNAYFRFNLSYKGNNPNYGNFVNAAGTSKNTPAYAILDLFAGIAGEKDVWNLGVFAKNVTNKQVELTRVTPQNNIYSPYASVAAGYDQVNVSIPREIGVTLKYAFGSR